MIRINRRQDRRLLYAILTARPGLQMILQWLRPKPGSSIRLLASDSPLPWRVDASRGATIAVPEKLQRQANRRCEYAWTRKIYTTHI